ncbi:MAG TPA: ribosome silencing factor [Vampirovibrionales bacterium]
MDRAQEILKVASEIADDRKALQPIGLEVIDQSTFCSFIFIVSQPIKAQVRALCIEIEKELSEKDIKPDAIEGQKNGEWVLMDYGDVVINLMHQPIRDYYYLEDIWRKAKKLEL